MGFIFKFFLIIFLLNTTILAQSIDFVRSPYLQRVSDTSVILRYRTNLTVNSIVYYGTDQNNLINISSENTPKTEHRLEITGLSSGTKYFYQILSSAGELTSNDGSFYFKTNPSPGIDTSTRIWAIGDSGRGNSNAILVKEKYLEYANNTGKKADLWLMLGDNAYNNGLDSEYNSGLFNIYPDILKNTVLWPTLGNHDGYAKNYVTGEIPYYASFSLPRNGEIGGVSSGTESYYSFDYANIHFISLNSYDENRDNAAAMATWLKNDLQSSNKKWKIAYWHHPPYSKGSHDSDREIELIEMRENILPILEDYGVDLVLTGHSHSYERSFLVDGHYGLSNSLTNSMIIDGNTNTYLKPPQNVGHYGAIYVVNGTAALATSGELNHPVMYTSQAKLASMIIDVDTTNIKATTIDSQGAILDSFIISKKVSSSFANSQKVLSGASQGKLITLKLANSTTQKLLIKKSSRYKNGSLKSIYKYTIPHNFFKTNLILNAHKDSIRTQNFTISYSLDGIRYKKLAFVTNYKKIATRTIPIPEQVSGQLFLQITNIPSKLSTGKLNVDQLILDNQ